MISSRPALTGQGFSRDDNEKSTPWARLSTTAVR